MPAKTTPQTHILGIRHHGPGSARSLIQTLEALQPDIILVEGPPEADKLLPLVGHPDMQPPVALLIYDPRALQRAVYYPFAVFSPEWQAIHFALRQKIPVRFMDLPQAHQVALAARAEVEANEPTRRLLVAGEEAPPPIDQDPLYWLAKAAGFSDGERWWEYVVEQRRDGRALFQGILEAMTALREAAATEIATGTEPSGREIELLRESYMRRTIRRAKRQGFRRLAVVCGAWHAPALETLPPAREDTARLKGLPKTTVRATWVPWSYGRLLADGYGAGIHAPGWYHHLWTHPNQVTLRWLTRVAELLRQADLDASPAQIIDAVRLADALAALRNHPLAGLPELNEAVAAVFAFGREEPLRLIRDKLIVGERLGRVPDETPSIPLQQDLQYQQRTLRLPPNAEARLLDLDLRRPRHLERSHLLHRLDLLAIPWGLRQRVSGKSGTFHEIWRLQWQPEFSLALLEASGWGNTVIEAATNLTCHQATQLATTDQPRLPALTTLLQQVLLANLPDALPDLLQSLRNETALSGDIVHLMAALPALVSILRYGNVRQTGAELIAPVVDQLVTRIRIGLPGACASLNDEAAAAMFEHLLQTHAAITRLQTSDHLAAWRQVLVQLSSQQGLHPLLAGRCTRLLLDAGVYTPAEAAQKVSLALSPATPPQQAAAWIEGLLKGSGLLLLHDPTIWRLVDRWLTGLPDEQFTRLLPLLRRTFATFTAAERRRMGERAGRGPGWLLAAQDQPTIDPLRAAQVLPVLGALLGLTEKGEAPSIQPGSRYQQDADEGSMTGGKGQDVLS